jgi:L,D-peptidoglycan transpeptidase YkuD (ErfK/YbiS/YcfS/YnhG family)
MKYHWGPQRWEAGGYRISYPVQLYNYVIAVNFNRRTGTPPRQNYQLTNSSGSGYWIHQRGLGSTRGCVSLTKSQIIATLRWLDPAEQPHIAMGPQAFLRK